MSNPPCNCSAETSHTHPPPFHRKTERPLIEIVLARRDHADLLNRVADGVFDGPVLPALAVEFLEDERHHLALALDDGTVVGMASAIHYVHPDKHPELWINEVGVADTHVRHGIASRLLGELLRHGARLGCAEAWVLTDGTNSPAQRLYESMGGTRVSGEVLMYSFAPADHEA